MKVLFLTASPKIKGPLPKLAPVLISALTKEGCIIETSTWSAHGDTETVFRKIFQRPLDIGQVLRKARTFHPDLMLVTTTHNWKAILRDLPMLLFVRKKCPKIVMHFHGSFSGRLIAPGNSLMKLATKMILQLSDAVLLFSSEEKREWSQFYPEMRYYLVDNPYVEKAELSLQKMKTQPPVILFVGRLIDEKGIFDLVEAIRLLGSKLPFQVKIAGVGPHQEAMVAEIHRLGISDRVQMLGYVTGKELAEVYRSASIFVLPSWREGFPLVLVEAMDYSLPIVTTRIRGAADRFMEGENCLFVDPQNPEQLAGAIEKLLLDLGLRQVMGANNKRKVKEYSPEIVGKIYYQILQEVINN